MNDVKMIGNLTRDIEIRVLPKGGNIGITGLAVSRKYKKTDGTTGEEVCFVDIVFFGKTAEIANQYLSKGSKVLISGRLKLDTWTDQTGNRHNKHSVIVETMHMMGKSEQQSQNNQNNNGNNNSYVKRNNIPEIDLDGEEIPF